MADELIQAGIFEGMTWWNTNPAKNFFPSGGLLPPPYCSMAAGVDALASTWAVADHQIINSNMAVLGCTASNRSSSTFFDQGPPVESMEFHPSTWNPQDIMGDYNTTIMQVGEWSDLNCGSSPPNSGTDGSTVTCDGQIPAPVDPTSMFPSNLINGDHEILPPCDWNNGTQVMGSSFQEQQQIINHIRATLLGGSPCSSLPPSPKAQSRKRTTTNSKGNKNEEGSDSGGEPTFKRQRIETPSSLPTFKVRKEKLGDRITALQQLVSPFGKTDTASVLHEAIEYIKFLHDQVNALSTPYRKNGAPIQPHHQQQKSRSKGEAVMSEDLRSRGLCLVPIASTFPVAHESPADFWTPTFGASSFR